jgi:SAM-dependent methyltransferase
MIQGAARGSVREVLELGSGGGNNASHMKHTFALTLVEPAEKLRELSRAFNPECEHVAGNMRTVRLGRTFDAVFVHDAVMYMTTEEELRTALATVAAHLAPGSVALVAPDATTETFSEATEHGGGRATCSGRCRPSPARPCTRRTTRFCCESPTGPCAPPTTCTARVCSRVRRGCGCSARSGSPRS